MAAFSYEQMILSLEKRLAAVEAAIGISPADSTVINFRFRPEAVAKQQQKIEVKP